MKELELSKFEKKVFEKSSYNESEIPRTDRLNHKVLIVEDDLDCQELIKSYLLICGYLFDLATNGKEALSYISSSESCSYSAILMDCDLPDIDGFHVTKNIRSINCNVPIVALTSHQFIQEHEKCIRSGMNDYLTKPIDLNQLVQVLDHWIFFPNDLIRRYTPFYLPLQNLNRELNDKSIIDRIAINKLTFLDEDGTKGLVPKLIQMYLDKSLESFETLKSYTLEKNSYNLKKAAHSFRSSNLHLGVQRVVSLLELLEHDEFSKEEILHILDHLEYQIQIARKELLGFLESDFQA